MTTKTETRTITLTRDEALEIANALNSESHHFTKLAETRFDVDHQTVLVWCKKVERNNDLVRRLLASFSEPPLGAHLNEIERQIIIKLVDDILAAGYSISVWDGEDFAIERSRDKAKIIGEVAATDETTLHLDKPDGSRGGWVQLIHGNDADVISDMTVNLAQVTKGAEELAERFQ